MRASGNRLRLSVIRAALGGGARVVAEDIVDRGERRDAFVAFKIANGTEANR